MPDPVDLDVRVEWEKEHDDFLEKRFTFLTEAGMRVPCHLLVPKKVKKPCPVVICLQGHSTGMHISMGRIKYDGDEKSIADGDRDFALQALRRGYAALVMEQRGFGERKSAKLSGKTTCSHPSMVALMMGRTMIGERIWDVSRAIDALGTFDEVDNTKVACMGNSSGGTTSFYAACADERIKAVMPSCSVGSYAGSWGEKYHCVCGYIPKIAKYFEMGDLACLIAPRPLIVAAGRYDEIAPFDSVIETAERIKRIYCSADACERFSLVIGEGGHRFYAEPSWDVFKSLTNW